MPAGQRGRFIALAENVDDLRAAGATHGDDDKVSKVTIERVDHALDEIEAAAGDKRAHSLA